MLILIMTWNVRFFFFLNFPILFYSNSFYFTDDNSDFSEKLETSPSYISRSEWNAKTPSGVITSLKLPVDKIIIAHSVTPECVRKAQCLLLVNRIQSYQMSFLDMFDISANWLVSSTGYIIEGRGWQLAGAHTKGKLLIFTINILIRCHYICVEHNLDSIGITLIGNFENVPPSTPQLNALKQLLQDGVSKGKISANYVLYTQKYFNPISRSPGEKAIEILKTWPHFVKSSFLYY